MQDVVVGLAADCDVDEGVLGRGGEGEAAGEEVWARAADGVFD